MAVSDSLETLLAAVVLERDGANTEALALGGSFARGTATQYSDIDIAHFVYVLPEHGRKLYTWRAGRTIARWSQRPRRWSEMCWKPSIGCQDDDITRAYGRRLT